MYEGYPEYRPCGSYRNNPEVQVDNLNGFTLPPFILDKIKAKMEPVYEMLKAKYGLTPSRTGASGGQADNGNQGSDPFGSNVQESPMAPSDAGSDV